MGKPLAKNLIRARFPLTVFCRSKPPLEELIREGDSEASSPKAVAESSEVIITMLPDCNSWRSLFFWGQSRNRPQSDL